MFRNEKKPISAWWNIAIIIGAVALVLLISYFLPHKGNPTTIYFNGYALTTNDIRKACIGMPAGTVVQVTSTISIDCGR